MSNAVAAERCAEESFATALASTFLAHSCSAVPAGMGGKEGFRALGNVLGFRNVQLLHTCRNCIQHTGSGSKYCCLPPSCYMR